MWRRWRWLGCVWNWRQFMSTKKNISRLASRVFHISCKCFRFHAHNPAVKPLEENVIVESQSTAPQQCSTIFHFDSTLVVSYRRAASRTNVVTIRVRFAIKTCTTWLETGSFVSWIVLITLRASDTWDDGDVCPPFVGLPERFKWLKCLIIYLWQFCAGFDSLLTFMGSEILPKNKTFFISALKLWTSFMNKLRQLRRADLSPNSLSVPPINLDKSSPFPSGS